PYMGDTGGPVPSTTAAMRARAFPLPWCRRSRPPACGGLWGVWAGSGSDGEPDGAQVVALGSLGERLGCWCPRRVELKAERPLCPLHAELVDGAGVEGRHRLRVVEQL